MMLDDELRSALWVIQSQLPAVQGDDDYRAWFEQRESQLAARQDVRPLLANLGARTFGLVLADAGRDAELARTLESIARQRVAPHELLVIVGDRGRLSRIERDVHRLAPGCMLRSVVKEAGESEISAFNRALDEAATDFLAYVSSGDSLSPVAIALMQGTASAFPKARIIYADEDWIDTAGRHLRPRFKSAWDPDAQLGSDLLGRLCFFDAHRARELGGLREAFGAASFYDLHCRLAFSLPPTQIRHVPAVLYHRQEPSAEHGSSQVLERYLSDACAAAADAAGAMAGAPVNVSASPLAPFVHRVEWPAPREWPKVSLLVPTRDRANLLKNCARGILRETDYPDIELIILDNDSVESETHQLLRELKRDPRVRVVPCPGPFNFSAMNNLGAALATGEVIVLMNNDIEVLAPDWLRELVVHALRPDVGCVGAKLLYADRTIQHAGVLMQKGPLAMHAYRTRTAHDPGEDGQLAGVRSYLAVTAACLAVRRKVYEEVGGLDSVNLKVAFNDVDFCLRVNDSGFRNICTPFAQLLHLESASRGNAAAASDQLELKHAARRWSDKFLTDPYVNDQLWYSWDRDATLCQWTGTPESLPVRAC